MRNGSARFRTTLPTLGFVHHTISVLHRGVWHLMHASMQFRTQLTALRFQHQLSYECHMTSCYVTHTSVCAPSCQQEALQTYCYFSCPFCQPHLSHTASFNSARCLPPLTFCCSHSASLIRSLQKLHQCNIVWKRHPVVTRVPSCLVFHTVCESG